jgi:hypothetical protein
MDPRTFNGGGGINGIPFPQNLQNNPYMGPPPGLPRTGGPQFNPYAPVTRDTLENMSLDQLEGIVQNVQNQPTGQGNPYQGRPW